MRMTTLIRLAISSVASLGIVLSNLVAAPGVALAGDEDNPWSEAAVSAAVGQVSSPIELGREFRATDPRRIVFDGDSLPVGTQVRIRHLGFRPHERIVEWTFKFVPGCPRNSCWTRLYVDRYTVDASGSYTFTWDTRGAEPGGYRFCTGGVEGCQWRYASLRLTAAQAQQPGMLVPIQSTGPSPFGP
jgi:hypothetical protein